MRRLALLVGLCRVQDIELTLGFTTCLFLFVEVRDELLGHSAR